MTEPTELQRIVGDLSPEVTEEQLTVAMDRVEAAKEFIREIETTLKGAIKEWVERHGKPVVIGPKKWCVVDKKKEKDRNVHKTAMAVLELSGGDFQQFGDLLSSNAFKPGALKKFLASVGQPEKFEELFEVTIEKDLEGKAIKEVKMIDERFTR